jgi:hypothetical protein
MVTEYKLRPEAEYLPEQRYLARRLSEIEQGLGRVAARLGEPTPITQPLDALDRARELAADLVKQVQVRPLEEAVAAQLAWLARAEARQQVQDGEPKAAFNRIALDQRILGDLLAGWQATKN